MFASVLQRVGHPEQRLFRIAVPGDDVRNLRHAGRNGSRLVKGNNLRLSRGLQRLAGFKQDAVLRPQAVAHHDGNRCCQPQRAGAGDHQHGDRSRQRKAQALSGEQPPDHHHDRDADYSRNKHAGNLIRNACNRGFGRRGIGNHAHDLTECGVLADPGRLAADESGLVDGRGADFIPFRLIHGDALSGQG